MGTALGTMSTTPPPYALPLPVLEADEAKLVDPGKLVRMLQSPSPAGTSQ